MTAPKSASTYEKIAKHGPVKVLIAAAIGKSILWAFFRLRRRIMWRLIEWLIPRSGWHNTVLDTDLPNVRSLKVKSLVIINSYKQERVIR